MPIGAELSDLNGLVRTSAERAMDQGSLLCQSVGVATETLAPTSSTRAVRSSSRVPRWAGWLTAGLVTSATVLLASSHLAQTHPRSPVDDAPARETVTNLGVPVPGAVPAAANTYWGCDHHGCATVARTFRLTNTLSLAQVVGSVEAWGADHRLAVDQAHNVFCYGAPAPVVGTSTVEGPCVVAFLLPTGGEVYLSVGLANPGIVVPPSYNKQGEPINFDWTSYPTASVSTVSIFINLYRPGLED